MSNSRRDFLAGTATTVATAAAASLGVLGVSRTAKAATATQTGKPIDMHTDGTYDMVELAKPSWTLGLVQSRVRSFDASNWKAATKDNLAHMLHLIDNAFYYGASPSLLQFHEFPLSGWRKWDRAEINKFSIEIPGEETEALAKKAREYDTWIVFGAYAKDPDWPGHVLSITTVMNNKGEIVGKDWKARNIKGVFPGFELFTTTVYDVLDRYVEMYGRDAVLPVHRTPLGNICTSSTQREPELFRAMAMKGAEIFLRTASGGFSPVDIPATAMYNGVYSSIVNNSISPDNGPFFDDPGAGGTAIYGPNGEALAEATSKEEQMVAARIPIAELRARHRQPMLAMELYRDVFDTYRAPYATNLWSAYLPNSLEDAGRYVKGKSRWK
ncbi:MAG: nitrilase-related carbon-nitrogen hydrolase [Rhodanobacter sp.]